MDNISPRPEVERDRGTVVRGGGYASDPKTSMLAPKKKKNKWSGYFMAAIGIVAAFAAAVAALYAFAPSEALSAQALTDGPAAAGGGKVAPKMAPPPGVRIAAFTEYGEYRAFPVSEWEALPSDQCAGMRPVGVELSAAGRQFIIALADAADGEKLKWAEGDDVPDISALDNMSWDGGKDGAKSDFSGKTNTKAILAHGGKKGIVYPAALAADSYYIDGTDLDWYLPASGQLWAICESRQDIDRALRAIGGGKLSYYWSSTEESASGAWYANVAYGNLLGLKKDGSNRVRAVADVPK